MPSYIGLRILKPLVVACVLCLSQAFEAAHAMNGLALVDASFASRIVDRQPSRLSQSCRLGSLSKSRLWFWMRLACTGECARKLAADGHVKVFVDWYLREDGILRKQASLPLKIKGTNWRAWGAKGVKPGVWTVVVRAEDSQWACAKDRCDFTIEVKP
jgi:hypothetical protein